VLGAAATQVVPVVAAILATMAITMPAALAAETTAITTTATRNTQTRMVTSARDIAIRSIERRLYVHRQVAITAIRRRHHEIRRANPSNRVIEPLRVQVLPQRIRRTPRINKETQVAHVARRS
jgi:hypothetical protein